MVSNNYYVTPEAMVYWHEIHFASTVAILKCMKSKMTSLWLRTALGCFALPLVTALFAQQPPATPTAQQPAATPTPAPVVIAEKTEPKFRRFSYGFRVRGFPQLIMHNGSSLTSTTTPQQTYSLRTTTTSPRVSIGPSLELSLSRRLSIGAEFFFNSVKYTKTTDTYLGTYTTVDTLPTNQTPTTRSEQTSATYWDFPLMLRFRGLRSQGILSKVYVMGGASLRTTGLIQSDTSTTYPDGTITSNRIPANPAKRNLFGKVAGVGFRLVDDINLKVMPEVRYTYWSGRSFDSDTVRSTKGQLEVSIAIIY